MRKLITLLILLITNFGWSQNCPDSLNNSPGNSGKTIVATVYDANGNVSDTIICQQTGGSHNIDCNLDSLENWSYISIVLSNGSNSIECHYDISGKSIDAPLPIELKEFNVIKEDGVNVVTWSTYSERNNDYFTIRYSIDGYNWEEITTIDGGGNSTTTLEYTYNHYSYNTNKINYYCLTQTDYNGDNETFNIVAVDNRNSKKLLLKVTNLMGQEVNESYKGLVVLFYDDGKTTKRYNK